MGLVTVVVDAPVVSAGDAVQLGAPSIAWAPRGSDVRTSCSGDDEDWSCVGWGIAARVAGAGAGRFAQVRAAADQLWSRLDGTGALPFAPRLFGGFAFDAEQQARSSSAEQQGPSSEEVAAAWADFADAAFVLPKTLYAYSNQRAILAAFVPEDEVPAARRRLDDLRRALEARRSAADASPPASAGRASPLDDPSGVAAERAYGDLVARALREIDRRAFAKIVLCRARRLALPPRADVARAFAFLDRRHTPCARFFLRHGAASFLGATPERLVLVRGRRVLTEALAGSLPRSPGVGEGDARAHLLASAKDRAEHAFVVAAIRESLAPVCEALSVPAEPEVRSLTHLYHLATPIAGTLAAREHVLDLAARLHPTPALCGSPKAPARAFLLANEAQPRGWYGGGVGWFDSEGDGSIHVAIRSALVARTEGWIYAGAGIVGGSTPERELAETIAKERTMRDALEAASEAA